MSARIIAAASLWLAIAASAPLRILAQTVAPAGRVVLLSDTLGANFPLADSVTKTGSLSDYDSLIGTWTFDNGTTWIHDFAVLEATRIGR